ncbi:dirigent protein 23-like [Andrographis paniculata]|uniref:dirigent protein 23-like n=1 Tax=Andrographis paniculata TaxID=175694 RepID=UPI0021E7B099|nr:dirigent protein 23-like [Andrographis paniculata]
MGKFLPGMAALLMLLLLVSYSHSDTTLISPKPEAVQEWMESHSQPNAKQKITKLRFYFHDVVSGKNPTSVTVAQWNSSATTPTLFGLVNVMDDPLTEGPRRDSKLVGWARGMYTSASIENLGLLMTLSFVFRDEHGSTITVVGHNQILNKYREMPVVGGSGLYRLARGLVTARTVWLNVTTKDAVVEYNAVLLHY